ncbi:uncharacterized protein LOC144330120 [Macaca mulatta]
MMPVPGSPSGFIPEDPRDWGATLWRTRWTRRNQWSNWSFNSSTSRDRHRKKVHQPGGSAKMRHWERRTSSGWPRTKRWKSSWLSLTDSVEPAPGEAREGSPHDNPTAQQITQLLPLTQDSPGAPRLGQQPLHAILFTVPRSGR